MIRSGMGPEVIGSQELVLVQVKQRRGSVHTKENTWAKSLGDDLYEIRGPLHLISGLNTLDIVKAVSDEGGSLPSVTDIVKRSGYKTLHVLFFKNVQTADRERILRTLEKWNVTFQEALERFYTIQISPGGDYESASMYLKSLNTELLLEREPDITVDVLLRCRLFS